MEEATDRTYLSLFSTFFHEHYGKLHRYAFYKVKSAMVADEIVYNLFAELWQYKVSFVFTAQLRTYVYATTCDRCGWWLLLSPTAVPPVEMVQPMKLLSGSCRAIFLKNRTEEKGYRDIAGELGVSVTTVATQMGKALRLLHQCQVLLDAQQAVVIDEEEGGGLTLISSYLSGKASPEGAIVLDDWCAHCRENTQAFEEMARLWHQLQRNLPYRMTDSRLKWDQFCHSLHISHTDTRHDNV
ncbi:sigma factor-like helix-turn-helix DNA-binding protein [Chitinophaga nivalis]|uniref:RNA polymerase sigma factor 70 region 4 type 2 domain-containing protein n=1 Tax=Chitinophaga nivalis TaxID=2991709 RepID=A0ABT3II22_9BACT|nr:sigma factor-like helix-turn-helix DNA-binding protein [Chitinophaga nivalis]MCW3466689.1 hypothetical protein [Chitinophaga nivalis]MCW3483620.1 hypothetical protein [Chitinophaga nivalis]